MARARSPAGAEYPTIDTVKDALEAAGLRPARGAGRVEKQGFATKFSNHLATLFARRLRHNFPEITPDDAGRRQEARARTAKGYKKLDVNYSTPELGLALGVSIKTITAPDPGTRRYTKNYTRIENELRAEATDYHQRQPYSVLIAVLFLPVDCCDDAGRGSDGISSFGAAVLKFRYRANRVLPQDDIDLFERFFIGVYETEPELFGEAMFVDVMAPPPKRRRPRGEEVMTLSQVIGCIVDTYQKRNLPKFEWADESDE